MTIAANQPYVDLASQADQIISEGTPPDPFGDLLLSVRRWVRFALLCAAILPGLAGPTTVHTDNGQQWEPDVHSESSILPVDL